VTKAKSGDRAAMEILLDRHYDRLYAVCYRIAGNEADASDACQEALLAIVKGLDRFDGRASFKTWSYRVASNATLDELRRRQRRPVPGSQLPDVAGSHPGFDQQVSDRVTLDEALPQLAEEFRVPVVLRDVAGLDYAEIARVLDIPPGTVRSRIARGRRHLSQLVGNHAPPSGRQR
jgi:RNA polymerase sigma-70 factor (ECF subfamily)